MSLSQAYQKIIFTNKITKKRMMVTEKCKSLLIKKRPP